MYDFKLLKPISTALYVLGMVITVLSILAGIILAYNDVCAIIVGICIALVGAAFGILILFVSCLINLLLQIEENTRKKQ